jgi:hypothetical protein
VSQLSPLFVAVAATWLICLTGQSHSVDLCGLLEKRMDELWKTTRPTDAELTRAQKSKSADRTERICKIVEKRRVEAERMLGLHALAERRCPNLEILRGAKKSTFYGAMDSTMELDCETFLVPFRE